MNKNKYPLLSIVLLIFASCSSQIEREITTDIGYLPPQRAEVTEEDYRRWTSLLKNTYEQIKSDGGNIVYADHLNIATSFIKLKEPKQKVLDQFFLAQQKNLASTAESFPLIYTSSKSVAGYLSQAEYDSLLNKFSEVMSNKKNVQVDPSEYASNNNLDVELVKLVAYLQERNQAFRSRDMDKQQLIDQQNIKVIDSLHEAYGKYIGNSLVGTEYQSSMWAVIQHADLEHQEKYLPIVHEAVTNGELSSTPLKMLIDRVYTKKYGYQIFGSQSAAELADDQTMQQVKSEYGL